MNPYLAIRTAGTTTDSDYTWKTLPHVSGNLHDSLAELCDQAQSFAVVRRDDFFDVYLGGVETGLSDYQQRDVLVSIAFFGLTEAVAHNLVVFAIEHAEEFAQLLLAAICRDSPDKWSIDKISAEKILDTANQQMMVVHSLPPFMDAWERFYTTYSADKKSTSDELSHAKNELIKLSAELKKHSFSKESGLKLMVSYGPSQEGYNRALAEADRFLWHGGHEVDLSVVRSKKKAPSARTTSAKSNGPSKTHSGGASLPPTCPSSKSVIWTNSNKGLVIICGVVAMGILLGITCKKKVPEPEKIKRAPTAVPATGETQKSAGKIVSPASDEKAVTPSKSDEKTTLEPEESKDSPVKEKTKEP